MKRGMLLLGLVLTMATVAIVTSVAIAQSATSQNWTVWAGASGLLKKPPPGTPKTAEADAFYPSALTIHAGDSVTIKTREGHTATLLGRTPPAFFRFAAKKGGVYSEIDDSTGTPFWFNGKPKYVYTTKKYFKRIGSLTIDNNTSLHANTIFGPDPHNPPGIKSSVTYTFPKPGVYTVHCMFHYPTMKLRVIVKPEGATIPTQSQVDAHVAEQLAGSIATAKVLVHTKPSVPNTEWAGISKNSVDLLQFFPAKLTVPVGTTVTLVNHSRVNGHNMVFGNPKNPWIKKYLSTSDQFPDGQVGPEEIYSTDPPGTQYDGTNHGNGFFVTRVTDNTFQPGFPASTRITFTQPGTYHFFCEIHGPEMSADIVVTG